MSARDGGGGRTGASARSARRTPARVERAPTPAAPEIARPVTVGRLLGYGAAVVLGGLVGAAGSLVQAAWFPGGLLLALGAVGAVCYGAGLVTGGRGTSFAALGGWLLAVMAMATSRPEGDFFFATGLGPQLFIFGGMLTAVMCTTLPRLSAAADSGPRLPK